MRDAQAKASAAADALEAARAGHAETLAHAAITGAAPKANGALRNARLALADAGEKTEAARTALDQLKADRGELDQAQAENAVLTEIARVLAPGERLLEQARRKKAELLILMQTLYVLTAEEQVSLADKFRTSSRAMHERSLSPSCATKCRH